MSAPCPRLFEAAALRDGRLSGAEVARFQAHLKGCPSCAREARALEALGDALRAPAPADTDELHVRRERTRLLAAFDASLVPAPRSHARLWLTGAAACVVLAALAVFFLGPPRQVGSAVAPPRAVVEPVVVRADSSARWSRKVDAQLERITLESGVLSIRVDHGASPRRLLVSLPDGELEDIGTTFSVSADGGRTTRVSVQDGSVVLRLHGKPALALGAGDSWSPTSLAAASTATAPVPSAGAATAAAASAPLAPRAAAPRQALGPVPPAPSAASSVAPELEPDPATDFRAAMSALNSGDNAGASARFGAFVNEHPRDSRAEDAAYLRVIALQRAGDVSAMKRAAVAYLSRYPNGFRKAEIEPLSRQH
jgi:Putative zinc-finger/FecR protein